jgi:flagellin
MSDISLSKAVRSNLLSLKGTADMMAATQNRLATGNKVNSALDNPSSWFTAKGLTNRASDLNSLLDSMANGVKTLEAADNGLSAMTKTLESMQSTLRQARQDKSFQTKSYEIDLGDTPTGDEVMSFSGGAVGEDAMDVQLTTGAAATATAGEGLTATTTLEELGIADADTFTIGYVDADGADQTYTYTVADAEAETVQDLLDDIGADAGVTFTASLADGALTITSDAEELADGAFTVGGNAGAAIGFGTDEVVALYTAKTVDELVSEINGEDSGLSGMIRASNDNGKLRLENQSTKSLSIDGATAGNILDGTTNDASTIEGNSVRAGLANQFNELRDQLDKLVDDASFNGINLLRGDKLSITFNETGTSSIDIQTEDGDTINSANLSVSTTLEAAELDSDTNIDAELAKLKSALNEVRSQASSFGSNLTIVENRQSFTKAMINTLEDGAGNLTLADMNTEAANLLALQTRQSLSQNSLSLASQADQSILQLIR